MVISIIVIHKRRYPDRIKAHPLNIVEMVDQPLIASSTIVAQIGASCVSIVISGKSICKDLIDCSRSPLLSTSSLNPQQTQNQYQ